MGSTGHDCTQVYQDQQPANSDTVHRCEGKVLGGNMKVSEESIFDSEDHVDQVDSVEEALRHAIVYFRTL